MATNVDLREFHRRWQRREIAWRGAEILLGLFAWGALTWVIVQAFTR